DSELLRPPPVEVQPAAPPATLKRLPPLLRKVKTFRRGLRVIVRFILVRKAKVGLIASRKGRTVGRTRPMMMRPGRHRLSLRIQRRKWPGRLAFYAREPGVPNGGGGNDGNTVVTGGDAVVTRAGASGRRKQR